MPSFEDPHDVGPGRRVTSADDVDRGRRKWLEKLPADIQKAEQQEHRKDVARAERNIAPARIIEPRCHVCQHPFRDWIELMLIKGMSYKGLGERVAPPVDRRSISNHYKNHMDLQDAAFRAIIEQDAAIQGLNIEEGINDILTKRNVLEVALRRGYDDIVNGVTTVEPRDLIQIAKILAEMDSQHQNVSLDEMRMQVQLFIQAIKDVCPPEIQGDIANRVKALRNREDITQPVEDIINDSPKMVAHRELESPDTDWNKYEDAVEATIVEES